MEKSRATWAKWLLPAGACLAAAVLTFVPCVDCPVCVDQIGPGGEVERVPCRLCGFPGKRVSVLARRHFVYLHTR